MPAGDITRSTFDAAQRFSAVRMQQGRVLLDADWNEQVDIQAHRDRAHVLDTVGPHGAPKDGGGFAVTATDDDLLLSPGSMWVGGTRCETGTATTGGRLSGATVTVASVVLDGVPLAVHDWVRLAAADGTTAVVRITGVDVDTRELTLATAPAALPADVQLGRLWSYARQPDLPSPADTTQASSGVPRTLDLDDGSYLAYLDVWQRPVTALEVPAIREKALGGPDTTTRTRTVWQLRLLALTGAPAGLDCDSDLSQWTGPEFAQPTGSMAARAEIAGPEVDLCTPTPPGGYTGLENQLYRVQVHSVDGAGAPRILWSRHNASVVTGWTAAAGDELTVTGIGPDEVLGFGPDQWVELVDDLRELDATPGTLVQLRKAEGSTLFVDTATADGSLDRADFGSGARARRWDSPGAVTAAVDEWTTLERGVQVRFAAGTYRPGDYWLVPVRTVVADVEWPRDPAGEPVFLPPTGVEHDRAPVALVRVDGSDVDVLDCRALFPSLTTLTARDVDYDPADEIAGVDTVHDALERLSRQRDLRRHHRMLHGWGIVCGLQLRCGQDDEARRTVTVRTGSAIDAEGNDVDLDADSELDVLDGIERLEQDGGPPVLDQDGHGDVCVEIARGGTRPRFTFSRFDPKADEPPQLFNGTLLMDFYDECLKGLHEWLRDELAPEETGFPVGPRRQLAAALGNLAAQPVNRKSGRNIYLSPREDKLLKTFYSGLRERLQSETFCAMFDGARVPPDFPAEIEGLDTVFGMGGHGRVRMRPNGSDAWTVGSGINPVKPTSLINRYDLQQRRLVARIDAVAGVEVTKDNEVDTGTSAVTDVAFSPDGRTIYAAIPTRNQDNTIFRAGRVTADGVDWQPAVTICGLKLVTLATTAADPTFVYAIGHRKVEVVENNNRRTEWRGAGLYRINPVDVATDPTPLPLDGFFPAGHLVITPTGEAVATAMASDTAVGPYQQLFQIRVPGGGELGPRIPLPRVGNDDLAVVSLAQPQVTVACVVVDLNIGKGVMSYEVGNGAVIGGGDPALVTTGKGGVSLLGVGDVFAVALADEYALKLVQPTRGTVVEDYLLPLQVGPVSLATDAKARTVVALNYVSNTLSVADRRLVRPEVRVDLDALATYRAGMLEAFGDLLGGFAQYLKDCFFDHFLVRCPRPTGDEVLYLGVVSVRGRRVYKICNFTRRRYVKSFPLVGYWLSVVPLLPWLARGFAQAACALVVEHIAGRTVDDDSDADDNVSVETLQQLLQWAQSADVGTRFAEFRQRRSVAGTVVGPALRAAGAVAPPPHGRQVVGSGTIGQPVDRVAERLADRGVAVRTAPVSDTAGLGAVRDLPGFFRDARAGDEVTLFEDAGEVRFFTVRRGGGAGREGVAPGPGPGPGPEEASSPQPAPPGADLLARVSALEEELAALRAERTRPRPRRTPRPPEE